VLRVVGFRVGGLLVHVVPNDPSSILVNAAELEAIVATARLTPRIRGPDTGARPAENGWRLPDTPEPHDLLLVLHGPIYLRVRHGFEAAGLGFFAGLPLIVSVPGDLLGGAVTDRLAWRYGLRVGRCGLGAVSYVIAGVALLAAAHSSTPVLAAALIALATGVTMFTLGAAWATVIEVDGIAAVGRDHELARKPRGDAQPTHRGALGAVVRN
jgi:hypothetical protein